MLGEKYLNYCTGFLDNIWFSLHLEDKKVECKGASRMPNILKQIKEKKMYSIHFLYLSTIHSWEANGTVSPLIAMGHR